MANLIKKLWDDPVWSKVISAAIIAGIAAAATHYRNLWFASVHTWIVRAWGYLFAPVAVSHWQFGLLVFLSALTVLALVVLVWTLLFPKENAPPDWASYTTDIFFDVRWRWQWAGPGQVQNFACLCPHCDFQIVPECTRDLPGYIPGKTYFHCDSCGRDFGAIAETPASLESKLIRFIQQKVRAGNWPKLQTKT